MNNNAPLYLHTVETQCNAALTHLACRIAGQDEIFYAQMEAESASLPVPAETHAKIARMLREEKRKRVWARQKPSVKRLGKICALLLLFLIPTGLLWANHSEAFKYRFGNFLAGVQKESLDLTPSEVEGLNGWYPSALPDGFAFKTLEVRRDSKRIVFENAQGNTIEFYQRPAGESKTSLDNEGTPIGQIEISGTYDAYWLTEEKVTTLLWIQGDTLMRLYAALPVSTLQEIAESLEFVK